MVQTLLRLLYVVLDLHRPLYHIIDLHVIKCLHQLLYLPPRLIGMLVVHCLNEGDHILKPVRIVLVHHILAPVPVAREELRYLIDVLKALVLVFLPNLALLTHQVTKHCLELELKLRQVEQQVDHLLLLEAPIDHVLQLLVLRIPVQHQPPYCHIAVSQAHQKLLHSVQHLLLQQLPLDIK